MKTIETITKAQQCADMLYDDVREAHREANLSNAMLELLLRDVLAQALAIRSRLSEIQEASCDL